jgi:hypothetical protein
MSQMIKKVPLVLNTKGFYVSLTILGFAEVSLIFVIGFDLLFFSLYFLLLALLAIAFHVYVRRNAYLEIHSDRVQLRNKLIGEKILRIEASKIEAVDVSDSLLGQKRYGSIVIVGSGGTKMRVTPVPNQHEVVELVRSIASAPQTKSDVSASSSGSDLAAQIRELEGLRIAGVLSEEEFANAKKKLLD